LATDKCPHLALFLSDHIRKSEVVSQRLNVHVFPSKTTQKLYHSGSHRIMGGSPELSSHDIYIVWTCGLLSADWPAVS
jgi:hypothetical protein